MNLGYNHGGRGIPLVSIRLQRLALAVAPAWQPANNPFLRPLTNAYRVLGTVVVDGYCGVI